MNKVRLKKVLSENPLYKSYNQLTVRERVRYLSGKSKEFKVWLFSDVK